MKRHYLRLVRRAFRALRHPRLKHQGWWQRPSEVLRRRAFWVPCRDSVAVGLASGLFFANMPMPFQMIPAAVVAAGFRGNVPVAMAGCWISNPITQLPFIIMQFKVGQWVCDTLQIPTPGFLQGASLNLPGLANLNLTAYAVGVAVCAVGMAVAAFPLVYGFSWLMPHHLPVLHRRRRTVDQSKGNEDGNSAC